MVYREGNMIVKDDEHQTLSEMVLKAGELAEEQLDRFFAVLDEICCNGVSAGDTHANLVSFREEVRRMKGLAMAVAESASNDGKTFVRHIDIADSYIYDI